MVFLEHTPIEEYKVGSRTVFVKREDLFGQPPMPPLAKLRGIRVVLEKLHNDGCRKVGILDTRVSKSGQGVAALCKYHYPDMEMLLGYPVTKANRSVPPQHQIAGELGAKLIPIQATRQSIMWHIFKRDYGQGAVILPHGLPFPETARGVAIEANTVPYSLWRGSLVLIVGTGTILTGILEGMPYLPQKIIGISAGKATETQRATMHKISDGLVSLINYTRQDAVTLLPPIMPYENQDIWPCPFPSHPNYDRKAWHWLCEHIDELPEPILFWNIGA